MISTFFNVGGEQQLAFAPLLVWGLIFLFGGSLGVAIYKSLKYIKGHKIAVLGMQYSGKTQLLAHLRNIPYDGYVNSLGANPYEKFTLHLGDRDVRIANGKDIPGGAEYIRDYYKQMIVDNEIIFFLFDAYRYLHDNNYSRQTQARLAFIYDQMSGHDKNTVIFATFADKLGDKDKRTDAYTMIKQSVDDKPYRSLFKYNFLILNMKDEKKVLLDCLNNKIFKK